jgi:hypothetical protein
MGVVLSVFYTVTVIKLALATQKKTKGRSVSNTNSVSRNASAILRREKNIYAYIHIAYSYYLNMKKDYYEA